MHEGLPDIGADKPDYWFSIPELEHERRCKLTPDLCEVDNEFFFVRGVIHIPVPGYEPGFGLGVWVSHERGNFQIYAKTFKRNQSILTRMHNYIRRNSKSDQIGPFFGWLDTSILGFPETRRLKTMAYYRERGKLRPQIVVEPTDHPLAVAQREGISLDEAWRIVHLYLPAN